MESGMAQSKAARPIPEIGRGRNVELTYPAGAILVADHGVFRHYGIAGDRQINGEQSVISCSWRRKSTVEEALSEFANGQEIDCQGLIGELPAHDILARARADIGKPWTLLRNNCEHHVTRASGLKPRSPQVRRAAIGAAAVAAIIMVPPLRIALLKGLTATA